MGGVLAYSEDLDIALELVTLAAKLGKDASVAIMGNGDISEATRKMSVSGVSQIFQASDPSLEHTLTGPVVDALEAIYTQAAPDLVVIGATRRGKDVAPKLATRLGLGCITDAMRLQLDGKDVIAERLVWGGISVANITAKGTTVVTVPARAYERAAIASNPSIVKVALQGKSPRVTVLGKKEKSREDVSLKDADIVVSAGRGFKKKEDLAILDGLTNVLNGVLGASRPLTSDLGWLPEERQVGLTGSTVKPKLYLAVGISGQIQHLTGMRDSKIVVGINNDKNAPIFQESDYGVVGDLYVVVPELVKELKSMLHR